jgi:voltage-gated potassium channel
VPGQGLVRSDLLVTRRSLRYVLPLSVLIVFLAGGAFVAFESDTVTSFWQGVWWALSLMTTVGFAGPQPATTAGHILSAVLMLAGFVLLTMTTAAVASLFVREDEQPDQRVLRELEQRTLAELRRVAERLEAIESQLVGRSGSSPDGSARPSPRSVRGPG